MAAKPPLTPDEVEHVLAALMMSLFEKGVLKPEEMQEMAGAANATSIARKDPAQRRAAEFIDEVADAFIALAPRET